MGTAASRGLGQELIGWVGPGRPAGIAPGGFPPPAEPGTRLSPHRALRDGSKQIVTALGFLITQGSEVSVPASRLGRHSVVGRSQPPCQRAGPETSQAPREVCSSDPAALEACRSQTARDAPGPGTEQSKIFSRNSPESPEGRAQGWCPSEGTGPELVILGRGGRI